METNRRRRWDKPKPAPKPTVHDVPNHVLELILLCLDSSICLVCAASACKWWHRVVANAGFQRRFRRLALGHYVYGPGDPIFVPSPTLSVHRLQCFSLDFVPKTDGHWRIADSRGGLVLLRKWRGVTCNRRSNPDLVVCDPRTRRHMAISVLPDILGGRPDLGLFLLDGDGCSIGISRFKVMAVVVTRDLKVPGRGVPAACVYSVGMEPGTTCSSACRIAASMLRPRSHPSSLQAVGSRKLLSRRAPRDYMRYTAFGSSGNNKTASCVPFAW
ncbi:unnamed protein product [Urochloa humidicola]